MYFTYDELPQNQQQEFNLFKKYYQERNPNATKCKQDIIPKVIHQIWIGPHPIPKEYIKLSKTWKKLHPNWQYKLWRDEDIKNWDFSSKDLYNKASSYHERADILRYEILNKYGGLYVDMDYEAIKNFDELVDKYDFFGSIEPMFGKYIAITNAIIGSKPNNPIFSDTLNDIRKHWDQVERGFKKHKNTMTKGHRDVIHLAVNRTMAPLKISIKKHLEAEVCAIVLPPTYMSIENRPKFFDKIRNFFGLGSKHLYYRTVHEETMARQLRGGKRNIDDLTNIF